MTEQKRVEVRYGNLQRIQTWNTLQCSWKLSKY